MKKQNSYISNKYLEQFLKSDSCMRQIRLRAKQGTVTNLHLEEIRELIIPIPTIKEQEKIASILSTVDEQIDNVDALIEKNKELKKALKLQETLTDYQTVAANVITREPSSWNDTLVIDSGSKDGLTTGMIVMANGGVVGRITQVNKNSSKVALLISSEGIDNNIPGRIESYC